VTKKQINDQIQSGKLHKSCFDCASKYRVHKPYNGILTQYKSECDICHETTIVTSARKLFGYHNFI